MPESERDVLNGSAQTLSGLFTTFASNCIFAVGIDATSPDFANGSATIFSGDDEHYQVIIGPMEVSKLLELQETLESASAQLATAARAPTTHRGSWQVVPRYASASLGPYTADDDLRGHPGLLAASDGFAAVLSCVSGDRHLPNVALHVRDGACGWRQLKGFHPCWLEDMRTTLAEAVSLHAPAGMEP